MKSVNEDIILSSFIMPSIQNPDATYKVRMNLGGTFDIQPNFVKECVIENGLVAIFETNKVKISWDSVVETNLLNYVVWKYDNLTTEFVEIGIVTPTGSGSSYEYIHIPYRAGRDLYSLKAQYIDLTEQFLITDVEPT